MIARILFFAALCLPLSVHSQIKVVASTADLAYFAKQVGGDLVEAEAIAPPTADIHFIEVRPSYMVKVRRADIALKVGLELDTWMDRIIDGSRNNDLVIADCSKYIEPLEIPAFKADARYGDIHRFGNPHYWLGPQNVEEITRVVSEALSAADPQNGRRYEANRQSYLENFAAELDRIKKKASQLEGKEIIYYHNSWPYFNEFTGLQAVNFVEPYPGVPPSPSHIAELTRLVKGRAIKVIAIEPYFDKRVPEKIAGDTGARVVTLYPSVGGRQDKASYIDWLEGNINALLEVYGE